MKIYNSLTRKKETFTPLKKGRVGMYICGPTVYDQPHIGHARAAYVFEVIRSYFEYKGFKVKFVRNITDVDDKIIAKAKEELPNLEINQASQRVAQKYTRRYYQDMDSLGIRRATYEPCATGHIEQMQAYISVLIKKNCAYEIGGDVYFDVRKFKHYGQLSHQNPDQLREAVRIEKDVKKKYVLDFALWKKAKPGEPSWDSPWGRGRPGWHIECSVMSSKYLGDEFDIHGGGQDLVFPHHENEIAQSQSYSGRKFARVWIHNGLLTINGQKMAKSLGNFVSVRDFIERHHFHPDILKLFFLQSHYSQPIDFSWEKMEEKREALDKIRSFFRAVERNRPPIVKAILSGAPAAEELRIAAEDARVDFKKYMDDDFNTPGAIAVIFDLIKTCNKSLYSNSFESGHLKAVRKAKRTIKEFAQVFKLSLEKESPLAIPKKEIKRLVAMRDNFRKQKEFKLADRIRKELEEKGIILKDTKKGTDFWRKL